ncbi:MAG: glucose 1-dehydrogenase [Chloroflexota bacterium]
MALPSLKELFDLSGKVAIVTGGGRGLGLEIAEGLGEAGARLVISGRRESFLSEGAAQLQQQGLDVTTVVSSVTEPADVDALVKTALDRHGRIDILVNNAGVSWGAPTLEMPLDRWNHVVQTNLTGTWLVSQAVCRVLVDQGQGGQIINVSSIAGLQGGRPSPDREATIGYNASKAGVIGLTRALATDMAPHNIRVNAICPGFFPSRMANAVIEKLGERVYANVPMGRIGRPGELKGVAVFLASAASGFITGVALPVDGGNTAW